jgi:hypothetical protein
VRTTEYWVRCLPPDMPGLQWTSSPEAGVRTPGYYLVGNLYPGLVPGGGGGYALVLDSNGVPVWYARSPLPLGAGNVESPLPGTMSFLPFSDVGDGYFDMIQLSPANTTQVPTVSAATEYATNLHEIVREKNGNFLVLGDPFMTNVDLTGLTLLSGGSTVPGGTGETIYNCAI